MVTIVLNPEHNSYYATHLQDWLIIN